MNRKKAYIGAAFLMATSAIGPGFLTQTSLFTAELMASFGFVILVSILLDLGVQLNIWRLITQRGERAQETANRLLPGMGYVLAALIAFGGLAFNVGNIAGTGMGLHVVTNIPPVAGAWIGCAIALFIFWQKNVGAAIDQLVKWLGLLMIGLLLYVVFSSQPPIAQALYRTVWPEKIDYLKIITIVGGTVGGYISFAGAHRLLDAGVSGPDSQKAVTRGAVRGILLTSAMRYLLFLAVLGVVYRGLRIDGQNPAAAAFEQAAGKMGYYFFGCVLWAAAITSVIGASYTTISFWKTSSAWVARNEKWLVSGFILLSTLLFSWYGHPVRLLVLAGTINGFILPVALALLLLAATLRPISGYRHSRWLLLAGWAVVLLLGTMAVAAI